MADTKISGLPAATVVAEANEFAINEAGSSKKVTAAQIRDYLGIVKKTLSSRYTNNTTTGTEITGLSVTLGAGAYHFCFHIITQSAAAATGSGWGVNFTGTSARQSFFMFYNGDATGASSGNIDDDTAGTAEMLVEGFVSRTFSTTAPDLGPLTGYTVANVNCLLNIEGILYVTASGDLELWAASEVAASQITAEVGSCVEIEKC